MLELIQGLTGFGAVAGCKGAADEVVTYQSSVAILKIEPVGLSEIWLMKLKDM